MVIKEQYGSVPAGRRKLVAPDDVVDGPGLEWVPDAAGGRWVARSYEVVRAVLRDEAGFLQAGFGAERARGSRSLRPPVLYLDGEEHRRQRTAAARLFAPKVIEGYRPMITALGDRLLSQLRHDRSVDLSRLSMELAVGVAAELVGLTNSSLSGMTRRLNTFFEMDGLTSHRRTPRALWDLVRSRTAVLRFHYLDVRPAIRARRRRRGADVISLTLDAGFNEPEVLTECLVYGAAGMVTTREFVTVAAWHLLTHPELLQTYREADVPQRRALLSEMLRLEPVIGHLFRRAAHDVELPGPAGPVTVRAGQVVDLVVRNANADETVVGEQPLHVQPGRELPRGVPGALASFGDGPHRCPGGPLAIMESEIFLTALLERDLVADGPPRVRWNPVTQGYDLDRFMIRLAAPAA